MNLTAPLEELIRRVESPAVTQQGAKAMADEMRKATASRIGADLRLSGMRGGAAQFKADGSSGQARVVITGAAYAVADKGRRSARARIFPRGEALSTPWGPRAYVRGSTSRGANITERASPAAFDAGCEAILRAVRSQ